MNLLVDTHILLWWLTDDDQLPSEARIALADVNNVVHVSAATIWEIAIKRSLGKLQIPESYLSDLSAQGFRELSVGWEHARTAGNLPSLHRDPFDRMVIAQAQTENLTLVTVDETVRRYDVAVLPSREGGRRSGAVATWRAPRDTEARAPGAGGLPPRSGPRRRCPATPPA